MSFFNEVSMTQFLTAIYETLYMTFISTAFASVIGLCIGILLYCTKTGGLYENRIISGVIDFMINVLRAIPFIILMYLLFGLSSLLTGSMLGVNAALPSLIFASSPFYARLVLIGLNEVDKGVIEASKSMGATNKDIILKVVLKEAMPSLISGIGVTAISLVAYTAMAGAIGSGGLGNLAYMYGLARPNQAVLYITTSFIVLIVFIIQFISDKIVKKIDKR